jgi:hypothetical protein
MRGTRRAYQTPGTRGEKSLVKSIRHKVLIFAVLATLIPSITLLV